MNFNLHHFYYPDHATAERLGWITNMLGSIIKNQEDIMATLEDLTAAQAATDALVSSVKADVTELLAKLAAIPAAGLTPEQQAALDAAVAHAGTINDALTAVDASAKA